MEVDTIITLTFLGLFTICGSVGNIFVLWFYLNHLKTALDVFIAALACVDFITCVLIIPFTMAMEILDHGIDQNGVCEVYYFLITSNVPFSVLLMVIIAFDRYLLINRPHLHVLNVRRAVTTVIILVCFVCVLGLMTTLTVGMGSALSNITMIHEDRNQPSFTADRSSNKTLQALDEFENSSVTYPHLHVTSTTNYFCDTKTDVLGRQFSEYWKLVYVSIYAIALCTVITLYALVYKEIIQWRRRRSRLFSQQGTLLDRQETEVQPSPSSKRSSSLFKTLLHRSPSRVLGAAWRNKQFYQNSKTAFMLFSITVIFTIVFLPAFLMMNKVIGYNKIVYYMYFLYNVANPVVYATLNNAFRTHVKTYACNVHAH